MEATFTSQDQVKLAYTFLCLETWLSHSGCITVISGQSVSQDVLPEGKIEGNLPVVIKLKDTVHQHILRYYGEVDFQHEIS